MSAVLEWLKSAGRKKHNPTWEAAECLIGKLDELDEAEKKILRTRWLGQVEHYERLWERQRVAYYLLRVPMVMGAATVPVLAGLGVARVTTALAGLAVAILTGLDSLYQLGRRWRQGRLAATLIDFEGWRFLELSGGAYGDMERREAYKAFLARLESLNEGLSTSRLDLFSERDKGSDLLD